MNTFKSINRYGLILALSLCYLISTHASGPTTLVDTEVEQRVASMASSIDLKYTEEVKKRIVQYTIQQRETSEVLLGRISLYFPLIEQKLRERGMPDDLKYLAVIESGLRPHARSRTGAAGIWQFMKPTARMFDLKITKTIDQRRDPELSTDAALDYLQYLYDKFGDWALAMAAYNCGPGNMNKAIRKADSNDFWKVSKYLPRETKEYVPKFIAMSYLMNYYYAHDLTPKMPENILLNTATSRVFDKISFKTLSETYNLEMETIQMLNPVFIKDFIPSGSYTLTLPIDHMMDFISGIETEEPLILYSHVNGRKKMVHEVTRDVLISPIAQLNYFNTQFSKAPILPLRSINMTAYDAVTSNRKYRYHTLRKKESLLDIARLHDMDLVQLMEINNFDTNNLPTVGDVIKIEENN